MAKDNVKGDCIFYTFDGTFRALLPGASYDRLRSIPHRFGEQHVIQYTALHHLASVKTLGLPGIVCLKEISLQAIGDRGLVVLIITDPAKLEGCFITTTSVLTPSDIDAKLGGNYRITKHNMITITHFEPVRVCSGDVIEVCEQPFGCATRSSFPSLRLEYHERTSHSSPAVLQPPQQEEDDPISDASEAEEIEDTSSNDPDAVRSDAAEPTGLPNALLDHDALNGGAWDYDINVEQIWDFAAPDDVDLYSGGTKKKKKKGKYDWPVEGTKEQPGPGGWYTPAGSDPAARSLGFPIPPCKICKRPMERSEGSLTGQCPRCNESFNNWGAFYMCPIPQHMKHAICGKCIKGDKSDSTPAAGPSEAEKQEMLHAVKAARLTPKGSVQKMLQGKAKPQEDVKAQQKEKVPPKERKSTPATSANTPKTGEATSPGINIQKNQEQAKAKAEPQKPPATLKESPTAALASALKKRREEDPLIAKNPKEPKAQKIFHQKDVKTTSKAAPKSSAPPVDDKKSKPPTGAEDTSKGSSSTNNPKSTSSGVIQPKKMPVSKFAPLNPAQPTKIGLSTATSLRHARVRQVIAQEPLYMLMGEMRLALGLFPTDAERALIAIHYIDEPEEFDIEQGARPEGLYAVLWKQHWVGFEVATIGGDPDHFLVHMWGLPKEQVGKWRSIWATHLAGFKTDFLVHNEVTEQGLCGWRLLQCWATSKKWDTSKKLDAKILPKDDREIVLRSKLAWRHAGPEFVNFASKVRAAFLANYDSYPADDTHWAASGGAPDTIDVDSPKAPSTAATASNTKPDPWANYDPWQKKKAVRQSRWEDLELPDNHPFSSPTGAKLQFVRQQELGPSKGGVAFATKSSVPQLMELRPKEPALLLIPQLLQEDPLQGVSNLRGPVEVIVIDPALQTTYKRQVHMIVLNQDPKSVIHSLPPPSISLTVADIAELIVECDARVVNKDVFQSFTDNPIHRFKNTFKEHCDIDFWANCAFYSYKFLKPKEGDRHTGVHQCVLKVQRAHRLGLLSFSGKNDLFIRDYVQKGSTVLDLSVLPRFWDVTKEARLDLLKAASKLPGFYGLVITKRGLAPRFDVKKLCSACEALLPQDDRLTDLNRSLIPRYTRESTGWPTGILAKDVVLAVHKAVATICIPIRSYRSSGCVAWTLAFQDLPTSFVFSVKVNDAVYEILITEKALPEKPSKGKGKGKAGKSKRSPSPATSTAVSTSSATIQEERIDRLEAKVGTLEKKHDALDHKIDNHYSGLSNQLRQVLQHLAAPKPHEPSGDTPPPKQPRHAWQEASYKFSWSPTATFFGISAGCMLWRSLCPGFAVPWYVLPWLVFAVPYQSFFLRWEWFHITLGLTTMGFNSSVLLLAPRPCNIWSWFGRLLALMIEGPTCLELCISLCSHAIMKESWNGMAPRWNFLVQSPRPSKDEYYILFYAATQFHAHLERPCTLGLPSFAFDCTKGYPGEGPDSWCITTANIDSLAAHPSVLSWDSDVLLLQETRCGENTLPASYASTAASGWKMVHGLPVPKLRTKNNVSRTNHGGVAALGKPGLVKPFVPPPEVKDTWTKLHSTCRITGCWVQATPSTRVLVFSFYGVTRASICATSAALTNDYLGMLFTVASAFGQVPIIIGGDFQSDPSTYKSVQDAAATGEWHDPLI